MKNIKKPILSALIFFLTFGVLSVGYSAYVSMSHVSSSDTLTSTIWNNLVDNIDSLSGSINTLSGRISIPPDLTGYLTGGSSLTWTNIPGRPTALSFFTNDMGYLTGGSDIAWNKIIGAPSLTGYLTGGSSISWLNITGVPDLSGYLTGSSLSWSNIIGKPSALSSFTNDTGYLTGGSSLTWSKITGAPTTLSSFTNDLGFLTPSSGIAWGNLTGIPSSNSGSNGILSSANWNTFNNKQATITGGASTITISDLTPNKALLSDGSGKVGASSVTNTELGYLSGVTSSIQTQINTKIGTFGIGTTNYISKFNGLGDMVNSNIFDDGTNVGIGTASPLGKLHIDNGNIYLGHNQSETILRTPVYGGAIKIRGDGSTWNRFVQLGYTDNLNNYYPTLTADTTGNVGIGTTNPNSKLTISSTGTGTNAEADAKILLKDSSSPIPKIIRFSGNAGSSDLMLYEPASIADLRIGKTDGTTTTDLVTFQVGGNVGVGTTSPLARTHISTASHLTGDSSFTHLKLSAPADTRELALGYDTTSDNGYIQSMQEGNGYKYLTLNPLGGNVGIGTTSPNDKLSINTSQGLFSIGDAGTSNIRLGSNGGVVLNTTSSGGIVYINRDFVGDFDVQSNSTSIARFTKAGNVGIGTTTPGYKLDVAGTINASAVMIGGFAAGVGASQWTSGAGGTVFYNGGNVGIGATSPDTKFVIQANTSDDLISFWNNTGVKKAYIGTAVATGQMIPGSAISDLIIRTENQKIMFSTDSGTTAHMTVATNGNVGIGTTSPSQKLDVNGDIMAAKQLRLNDSSAGVDAKIKFVRSSAGGISLGRYDDSQSSSVQQLTIDNAGNVGIGTTSPNGKLDVQGGYSYFNGLRLSGTDAGNTIYQSNASTDLSLSTVSGNIYLKPSGSTALTALSNGNVGIGTSSPSAKLHISRAKGADYIYLDDSGNASLNARIGLDSNGSLYLDNGLGATDFTIQQTTGNVGIGTSSPGLDLGTGRTYLAIKGSTDRGVLQLTSSVADSDGAGLGNIEWDDSNSTNTHARMAYITSALSGTTGGKRGSYLAFATKPDNDSGAGTERMRIDNSGNIGIGITSGLNSLLNIQGTNSGVTPVLSMYNGNGAERVRFTYDVDNIKLGIGVGGAPGTSQMTLTSAGNVGIGTVSPSSLIYGTVKVMDLSGTNPAFVVHNAADALKEFGITNHTSGVYFDSSGAATASNNGMHFRTWNTNGTNGVTEALTILSSGNVGIGTTSPNGKLEVAQTSGTDYFRISRSGLHTWGISSSNNGTNDTFIIDNVTDGTIPFAIDKNGSIGIGTTSPINTFQVISASSNGNSQNNGIQVSNGNLGLNIGINTSIGYGWLQSANWGSGYIPTIINPNGGNVGIGTTTPYSGAKLDVRGGQIMAEPSGGSGWSASDGTRGLRVGWSSTGFGVSLEAWDGGAPKWGISRWSGTTPYVVMQGLYNSNDVNFTGNVGIGTTSPNEKLDVLGSIVTEGSTGGTSRLVLKSTAAGGQQYEWYNDYSGAGGGILALYNRTSGNAPIAFLPSGFVGLGTYTPTYQLQLSNDSAGKPNGGSWANSSDKRIKKNIVPVSDALEKITALQGVHYEWRNPGEHAAKNGEVRAGFLAQDVAKVFPQFVSEIDASGKDKSLTPDGKIKNLSLPFDFDAYIVEAIKELSSKFDEMKSDIEKIFVQDNDQNKKIGELEKENKDIKKINSDMIKRLEILEKKIK